MRQDENLLIQAIKELSWGNLSAESVAFLRSLERPLPVHRSQLTHLCAKNLEVELYNIARLEERSGVSRVYEAEDSGDDRILRKMIVQKV